MALSQQSPKIILSKIPDTHVHPSTISIQKRVVDVVGSLVGLALLGVCFVPVAIAIKVDSPGPIFFRQERFGLRGSRFFILKFRSMVNNAEQLKERLQNEATGHIFKNRYDPRVTNVGRFLRKTSIDELPQFLNVLKGEMSLVGTRPPIFDEVKHYDERHWQRLNVKPGLTGEWQVNGRSSIKDFEVIVDMDLRYQQLWSPWRDLRLIWKTILIVIDGLGAY